MHGGSSAWTSTAPGGVDAVVLPSKTSRTTRYMPELPTTSGSVLRHTCASCLGTTSILPLSAVGGAQLVPSNAVKTGLAPPGQSVTRQVYESDSLVGQPAGVMSASLTLPASESVR